jgi:hypothetical protein
MFAGVSLLVFLNTIVKRQRIHPRRRTPKKALAAGHGRRPSSHPIRLKVLSQRQATCHYHSDESKAIVAVDGNDLQGLGTILAASRSLRTGARCADSAGNLGARHHTLRDDPDKSSIQ